MRFDALVLSSSNEMTRLTLEASSEAEAARQVERQAFQLVELKHRKPAGVGTPFKRKRFSLLLFSQELNALLLAGLSLLEALDGLVEKEQATESRAVLAQLIVSVREGRRFSDALEELPLVFPALFIGLVRAAETTGDLPSVLARYVEYQQRVEIVRHKIVSSSIYPAILLSVGGAVTIFLCAYVVPRFASIYQGTGRQLPFLSAWLLEAGQFMASHALPLAAAAVSACILGGLALAKLLRSGALGRLIGALPSIGPRIRLYEISRLYLTLGMLLESGIPVVVALSMSEGVVSRRVLDKLKLAKENIAAGAAVSDTFEAKELTTAISFRMIRVGERSGQLGNMLMQASNFYDGDIARFIDRFTRAFEPLMMVFIGAVVGGIVVMLYMPIFDLAGSLQ